LSQELKWTQQSCSSFPLQLFLLLFFTVSSSLSQNIQSLLKNTRKLEYNPLIETEGSSNA